MPIEKINQIEIESLVQMLDMLSEDTSIPKNVRASIAKSKMRLMESDKSANEALTTSIHALEEIVNDINIPMHARTTIWNLLSELEVLKEQTL